VARLSFPALRWQSAHRSARRGSTTLFLVRGIVWLVVSAGVIVVIVMALRHLL
jgi:uncharacterized membrane protein YidH (DUF202 family)